MKFITSEWLKAAFEDIQLMKTISGKQELTGASAFHSQQAVEKCFEIFVKIPVPGGVCL